MLQTSPTFSNITTSALIDGEDVVKLYLRTHSTPALDDFEDFLDDQCHLLDDMHDAFQSKMIFCVCRIHECCDKLLGYQSPKNIFVLYFMGSMWLYHYFF